MKKITWVRNEKDVDVDAEAFPQAAMRGLLARTVNVRDYVGAIIDGDAEEVNSTGLTTEDMYLNALKSVLRDLTAIIDDVEMEER